jgi:hypothetical protein
MQWLKNHLNNPYPSEDDRIQLCEDTGLSRKQLRIWLIDARRRKLKRLKKGFKMRKVSSDDSSGDSGNVSAQKNDRDRTRVINLNWKLPENYKPRAFEVFQQY